MADKVGGQTHHRIASPTVAPQGQHMMRRGSREREEGRERASEEGRQASDEPRPVPYPLLACGASISGRDGWHQSYTTRSRMSSYTLASRIHAAVPEKRNENDYGTALASARDYSSAGLAPGMVRRFSTATCSTRNGLTYYRKHCHANNSGNNVVGAWPPVARGPCPVPGALSELKSSAASALTARALERTSSSSRPDVERMSPGVGPGRSRRGHHVAQRMDDSLDSECGRFDGAETPAGI
ncbi:hypothetical protein AXG93_3524s1040 [Marchantia polymorpha subsp. ruderalis]|uniref:Uncharacterized protein n=1 Tax=Marchantia polymorpha subsp. ruderalis TaxID=1480154 RepID=A0A176WRM9_MARPO|nr:hypothetical protein AXG93_3524s1040 [Marchantia polymorpha subsp. ruderalis]